MSYDNTNSGALFKNHKKQTDNQPDYRGDINVGGTEFWLSAWLKTSKKGMSYMSLSVQQKDASQHRGQPPGRDDSPRRDEPHSADFNDDLPPF